MNILGFMGWASHDPGACIIRAEEDGSFRFCAISEERLNRVKYSYHFPLRSIKYCLETLQIPSLDHIDLVINDWSQHQEGLGSNHSFRRLEYDYIRRYLNVDRSRIKLIPSHHLAHAYSAFIPSGLDEAAILVVDAIGSKLQGTSLFYGRGKDITLIESSGSFSLGKLYDAITRKILNFGIGEDGKTMGLAAFGEKFPDMAPVLNIHGKYDGLSVDYSQFMRRMPDNRIMNAGIKKCDEKKKLYEPYYSRIAYEVQLEVEQAMLHLARYAKEKTGCGNLCIAGGVGLNCVANERIRQTGLFEHVFVQPASSDAGVPFGLALYGYYTHCAGEAPYKPVFKNAYTGRSYSDASIEGLLSEYSIPFSRTTASDIAQLLSKRYIVGWFTGGSEFGPRALGHRSILADPRSAEMKDLINAKVKHRELYRPFAPSVLTEHAREYFDLGDDESPFMLLAPKIHPDKVSIIPAVAHVDGTGRVQTVSKENCPEYYELISAFYRITGVPLILNTSFNDNDEPIVETPFDALICFLRTNIDFLVLNSKYLVSKADIADALAKAEKAVAYRNDALKSDYKILLRTYLTSYSVDELKEFLRLNKKIAEHYKNYAAYEALLGFLCANRTINYIGDRYHYEVTLKLTKEFLGEFTIGEVTLIEDIMENLSVVTEKAVALRNGRPVLLGFYNMSEALREKLTSQANIFIPYTDFQVHLENVVNVKEPEVVDMAGIEEFSCEYNMSKNFDKMF